jgi:tape measure domain-containing protein
MAGVELATAYISLVPTTVNLKPAMEKQFAPAEAVAASSGREAGNRFADNFSSATSKVGAVLGGALKAGVGIAIAAAGAAGAVGIKTAAALEQSEIAFSTMLGSGEKAKAFLADLSKFAAKTPFDMPGLQTAASSLVSAGIDSAKVIPIMTSLGNATSGMGTGAEGIKRATVALQQMNAAGKISGEDLNQLRDAGIPVFDLLTAATGKTTAEIAEMANKGKLGRVELEQLMTALETGKGLEKFNGLMEKQSQSLTGMWSTFKDTFETGMAASIQPLIPLMKDGLGGATTFLTEKVFPKVTTFVAWMAEAIPAVFAMFKGDYTGAFSRAFGVEEDSRIVGFLFDLRKNISGTFTWFKDAVSGLYAFIFQNDYTGAFGRAFGTAEDSSSVAWMFNTRDAILGIFANIGDGANGLYALLIRADYTGALQRAFGWEEDNHTVAVILDIRAKVVETAAAIRENTADLWAGLSMSQADADAVGVPLEGAVAIGRNIRAFFGDVAETLKGLDYSSTDAFFTSLGDVGGKIGPALGSIGESVKTLLPAMAEFGKQMPDIAGGGVTLLAGALGFLADHVDTIIQFMPLIVAGFVAWKLAQIGLNAAAAITPGLQLAVNISRIQAARAEMGLASAHRASRAAIAGTTAAESTSLATRIRSTAATIGQKVATVAASAATKAAAAGQWLLNAAMTANPIGIVVAAIALLVGGLIWFFTQTELGQQIIAGAWGMIQDAIGAVVSWFTSDILPTLQAAIQAVGAFFGWLYEAGIKPAIDGVAAVFSWLWVNAIKPVFDFITTAAAAVVAWFQGTLLPGIQAVLGGVGAVFTWLWTYIIQPIFGFIGTVFGAFYLLAEFIFNAFVAIIQKIVVPAIIWLWENVIRPVFQSIGDFIGWVWNTLIVVPFNALVDFVTKTIPDAINWLYDNAVKPVFDKIGEAAMWVWDNVLKPYFNFWVDFFTVKIPAAINWLYDNAVKPVFDKIAEIAKWVWDNVLSPYFNFWIDLFTNKIPGALNWLYDNAIKPVFDKIGEVIKWVWDNVVKPVFDTLSNAIEKDIPKAFESGVAFVKTIWEGLQEIVKAPIRFVVNTVLNDGLINALNGVADFLQIKKLPRIALPPGFADGGYTGAGAKTKPAGIVHAGEFVLTKEQTRKAGIANLYAMASALDGYAQGGLVHPLMASVISRGFSSGHNGIDFGAPEGTPVIAAGPGRVSKASWSDFGGGNEVHVDHPNGLQTWYAHLSRFAVAMGAMVGAGTRIGDVGTTGNSTGPHLHYMVLNGGWPNVTDPAAYLGGAGDIPAGGKPWNPISAVVDGLAGQFKEAFPAGGFVIDFIAGAGKSILQGAADFITDLFMGNTDKSARGGVTPLLYDGGGWLENTGGAQLIQHNKRRPDAVLTDAQWNIMRTIAGGASQQPGTVVNFNGPVYGNPEHIVNEMEARKRRAATLSNLTSITVGG